MLSTQGTYAVFSKVSSIPIGLLYYAFLKTRNENEFNIAKKQFYTSTKLRLMKHIEIKGRETFGFRSNQKLAEH